MIKEKFSFQDQLSLDRTYLAKERTALAYIRTGLALIGVALFIHKFLEIDMGLKLFISLLFGIAGSLGVLYGIWKTVLHHRERKELEEKI